MWLASRKAPDISVAGLFHGTSVSICRGMVDDLFHRCFYKCVCVGTRAVFRIFQDRYAVLAQAGEVWLRSITVNPRINI